MVAEILSLSKARKAQARDAGAKKAEQNRILFGRTKAEKQLQRGENSRVKKILDGAKRGQTERLKNEP
jgi:Domain of unknown function (DUF4169)